MTLQSSQFRAGELQRSGNDVFVGNKGQGGKYYVTIPVNTNHDFSLKSSFGKEEDMKRLLLSALIVIVSINLASAQSNRIVFGPLEGNDAGVLTVSGGDEIVLEMWARTDPDNPTPVVAVSHGLISEDAIISVRNGVELDPLFDTPNWESTFLDGPFVHNPDDNIPIPEGHTCEMQGAIYEIFNPPPGDPLDTQGEWVYYGAFLMTVNPVAPSGETHYPFSMGWYPHSGQGTSWAFEIPPGGQVEPEQDYAGLDFPPLINKIIFGPRAGDDAGVLTVLNDQDIEIDIWVQTDEENPAPVYGVLHGLLSEDAIIAARNGVLLDPDYDMPDWEEVWVDGPFTHNPEDNFPIPEEHTCEMQGGNYTVFDPPVGDPLDTQGEWDYYGSFLMTTNTGVPIEDTYYPFSMGWYPETGEGTHWSYEDPPGSQIVPDQDYGGLFFTVEGCEYIPGDCDHNTVPLELVDILALLGMYRGTIEPIYTCACPPHGIEFVAEGDPNGNCVALELEDIVTEISAYRGWSTVSSCPDCPGSLWLGPDGEESSQGIPSLKSKVKIDQGLIAE